jgi:hypothetical protein
MAFKGILLPTQFFRAGRKSRSCVYAIFLAGCSVMRVTGQSAGYHVSDKRFREWLFRAKFHISNGQFEGIC